MQVQVQRLPSARVRAGPVLWPHAPLLAPTFVHNKATAVCRCENVDPDLGRGRFKYKQLSSPVQIQAHVRKW